MRHVMLVTILHGLKQYLGHITGLLFVVVTLLHNPIKEFTAHHFFRHEVVVFLFLKDIVETDNVGVLDFLQNRNLVSEGNLVFFRQLGLGDNLNGKGFARRPVGTLLDDGKGTGTELSCVWVVCSVVVLNKCSVIVRQTNEINCVRWRRGIHSV
jgi:hypothetical protein